MLLQALEIRSVVAVVKGLVKYVAVQHTLEPELVQSEPERVQKHQRRELPAAALGWSRKRRVAEHEVVHDQADGVEILESSMECLEVTEEVEPVLF